MGPSVMMSKLNNPFIPLSNSALVPLIQLGEERFPFFFAKDQTEEKPIIFERFIPSVQGKLIENIERSIWQITNEMDLFRESHVGIVEEEVEDIEGEISVYLRPKRTTPAIVDARFVGRAEPVVTFDFVDDEIIDW